MCFGVSLLNCVKYYVVISTTIRIICFINTTQKYAYTMQCADEQLGLLPARVTHSETARVLEPLRTTLKAYNFLPGGGGGQFWRWQYLSGETADKKYRGPGRFVHVVNNGECTPLDYVWCGKDSTLGRFDIWGGSLCRGIDAPRMLPHSAAIASDTFKGVSV